MTLAMHQNTSAGAGYRGSLEGWAKAGIRQVEVKALAKLEALRDMMALRDYVDEGPIGKRRLPRLTKADLDGVDPATDPESNEDADEFDEDEDFDDYDMLDA